MKITIESIPEDSEPEIILRCNDPDEAVLKLLYSIQAMAASRKLIGMTDLQMHIIDPDEVYYFEAVDHKVFIYCAEKVYESRLKLYEIELAYAHRDFFRASKSTVLNIAKIKSVSPLLYGRFEALLHNGEKVIISRQYVPVLRQKLGL
ncbi:LytTR family transcriptional regulator DNA-binding domain-containing protein [Paenibacillus sonchi]|uniref:LytTR family transcriptional regulator DNA-binding domain-containing protein n=1 Tax=Paenibacillus sonchi TaxID=373687 RepID=A0A974SA59_9BACL|nr:LytTR family DNA-binding domain-containing protein [Paenibacillus sonchi]QQZ59143.1 LytTR family transcriptional regulator DNA-binding domain-containing protein [Paenibacillus sonchi]